MNRQLLLAWLLFLSAACEHVHAVNTVNISTASFPFPAATRNDLLVDFDFYLAEQNLTLELTSGEIIYDACPQCDPVDLSYMTSVFLGGPASPPASSNVTTMTPIEWDVTWSPTPLSIVNQDNFHVARVFLSPDAQGAWSYIGHEASPIAFLPAPPAIRGTILAGVMAVVPEPGNLSLIIISAGAVTFRRP